MYYLIWETIPQADYYLFWGIFEIFLGYACHLVLWMPVLSCASSRGAVGGVRLLSFFGYSIPASPRMHFVALRCTFSVVSMSLTECGAQTWFAYSRSGLTSALYKLKNVLLSRLV